MFSLLVRRDGLIEPPSMGETDVHCHILPGIDDGPSNERGSLAIARLLIEMGIKNVVATPHVISDLYPNSTEAILDKVEAMRRLLVDSGLNLNIMAGAEYYAEGFLLDRIAANDLLAFGDEKYVLFESPVESQPMVLEEIAFSLQSAGYTPLLAHVERYRYLQSNHDQVVHLKQMGIHFQVNHPSFMLPRTSRRGEMARRLYIKGMVDFLGTDMHRATYDVQPSRQAQRRSSRSESKR